MNKIWFHSIPYTCTCIRHMYLNTSVTEPVWSTQVQQVLQSLDSFHVQPTESEHPLDALIHDLARQLIGWHVVGVVDSSWDRQDVIYQLLKDRSHQSVPEFITKIMCILRIHHIFNMWFSTEVKIRDCLGVYVPFIVIVIKARIWIHNCGILDILWERNIYLPFIVIEVGIRIQGRGL